MVRIPFTLILKGGLVMKKLIAVCFAVTFFAFGVAAEEKAADKAAPAMDHTVVTPADTQWQDAPPVLPAGAKIAVLKGDPSKEGIFVIRLMAPAGSKVMPHWHPTSENVTVISGELHIGMGDKFDKTKGVTVPVGGFISIAPMMHHYAWMETETVVQIGGMGPFQLIYVNPKDDPSRKKK